MTAQSHPSGPSMTARVTRLEELVKQGVDFDIAKALAGLSEDDVRKALGIPAGTKLTNRVVLTHLVQQVGKNRSGIETANRRVSTVERRVTDLEQLLGKENLSEAIKAGTIGGRKSFAEALYDRKVDRERIQTVLGIYDDATNEFDYSDEQLFAEMFTMLGSVKSQVKDHEGRLRNVEHAVGEINKTTTSTSTTAGEFPWLGLIPALLLGLLAGILWKITHPEYQTVKVGQGFTVQSFHYAPTSGELVVAWMVGIAVAALVLALIFAFAPTVSSMRTDSTTETSSRQSRFQQWQANRRAAKEQRVREQEEAESRAENDDDWDLVDHRDTSGRTREFHRA